MNKGSLVTEVANRTGIEKPEVARVVNATLDVVREAVAKGERVTLSGFGTFERRRRHARVGRNPHTGRAVPIPPTLRPAFRPGKAFRDAVGRRGRRRAARSRAAVRSPGRT